MNRDHLERLASAEWRTTLRDHLVPFALGPRQPADLGANVLEVGPGPGLTTDLLSAGMPRLTAVEIDGGLAASLGARSGANVTVVNADAADLCFTDGSFTGVVALTMLHHVPTVALQDRLFSEARRVMLSGALLVVCDAVATDELAVLHEGDTYNPVDPVSLVDRLTAVGFADVEVRTNPFLWACHARVP